jgi:hypothetical protein
MMGLFVSKSLSDTGVQPNPTRRRKTAQAAEGEVFHRTGEDSKLN